MGRVVLSWPDLGLSGPQIMAVLNVTPDSFSDGGRLFDSRPHLGHIVDQAALSVAEGATILDIGGESTRPGADPVSEDEELSRVVPVVEALASRFEAVLSVDTSTAVVMTEAAQAGARLINDVRALTRPGALEAALETGLPVSLMHMQGSPKTMQDNPTYHDPVAEVKAWLLERAEVCQVAGIKRNQILIDPGFGFGKTLAHNVALFQQMNQLIDTGYPVVVGVSRKSMIGEITGRPLAQRTVGSATAAAMAAMTGASVLRVHDVAETRDAMAVMRQLTQGMQQ